MPFKDGVDRYLVESQIIPVVSSSIFACKILVKADIPIFDTR